MTGIDPAHLTDAELAAWYGSGLHAPKAQRLIEEVRRLRRDLNDERVRNQHDRDLARELSRRLAEVEIHNDLAEAELEAELDAKRELIGERDALADEVTHLRGRLAEVEAERDAALAGSREIRGALLEAEARLAGVMAVFGERDCPNGYESNEPGCGCYICQVRAAARGEGDR